MKLTRRGFLRLAKTGAALGIAGYGGASNIVEVADVEAPLAGLRLPLRVMFVADLHAPRNFVGDETLAAAAAEFRADALVVGGDSVDRAGNEPLVSAFAPIPAPHGKLAVLGNWEYRGRCDIRALGEAYRAAGVRLLVNEVAEIDRGVDVVRFVGLDDLVGGSPRRSLAAEAPSFEDVFHPGPFRPSRATIVLAHCPAMFDRLPPGPLLCLSGHTHGGQIAPFGIALFRPDGSGDYVRGWYGGGDRRLYVTRGLGNSILPFRVGSRPEIVRLTLLPPTARSG